MSGGMRIDGRTLPPRMQEQVAAKIVAQILSRPVAGREEKSGIKVPVRRIRFMSAADFHRYQALRDAVHEGVISQLCLRTIEGNCQGFTYKIEWAGEFVPTGISISDLINWRTLGKGFIVTEVTK